MESTAQVAYFDSSFLQCFRVRAALLGLVLLLAAGCDEPVVAQMGSAATVGGIEFTVSDYDVRYLELTEGEHTYEYPRPVLSIPVTIKNVGEDEFTYNPTHKSQQMTEASTPLLYRDPGPEADLPPESKTPINGVFLEKGSLEGQLTSRKSLAKGESVTDIFLFEVPDPSIDSLIFSLPPSMHRGKLPVLFRMPYEARKPSGPKVYSIGEPVDFPDATFEVTGAAIEYVKTKDTAQGEGFSKEPLFKVTFEIKNTSDSPLTYRPDHRSTGSRGASLFSNETTYKRVRFGSTTSVVGQKEAATNVAPGESVTDFVIFERPGSDVEMLRFEYPASLFESEGLARVQIPYEYADPEKPKELAEKKDGDDKDG